MKRFVKPAILIAAVLLAVTVLAPSAQAQYRSYYYSSSADTYSPPPPFTERPGPTPIVLYARGAGTPVNFGTGRAVYYEPGYPTAYRNQRVTIMPPEGETSYYFTPTMNNRPSYTYTPGYYTYYYLPAYYTPTRLPTTRYYRD